MCTHRHTHTFTPNFNSVLFTLVSVWNSLFSLLCLPSSHFSFLPWYDLFLNSYIILTFSLTSTFLYTVLFLEIENYFPHFVSSPLNLMLAHNSNRWVNYSFAESTGFWEFGVFLYTNHRKKNGFLFPKIQNSKNWDKFLKLIKVCHFSNHFLAPLSHILETVSSETQCLHAS